MPTLFFISTLVFFWERGVGKQVGRFGISVLEANFNFIVLKKLLKMGQPRPLFCLFLSIRTENLSSQQDSNSDCQSRRQERWPLGHQPRHIPNFLKGDPVFR